MRQCSIKKFTDAINATDLPDLTWFPLTTFPIERVSIITNIAPSLVVITWIPAIIRVQSALWFPNNIKYS